VKVGVGITNDKEAEITRGLAAGDTVIDSPDASLTRGSRVKKG